MHYLAKKHMKRGSTSLIIRKMKIKTTWYITSNPLAWVSMAAIRYRKKKKERVREKRAE